MADDIMTAQELAAYLKIDKQTVYRKFRRGELPGVKVGRVIRFRKAVIDAWLAGGKARANLERWEEIFRWGQAFAKERGITEEDVLAAFEEERYGRVASSRR